MLPSLFKKETDFFPVSDGILLSVQDFAGEEIEVLDLWSYTNYDI